MALQKIRLNRDRLAQLKLGPGNNQQVRASDLNPVIDVVNEILDGSATITDVAVSAGTAAVPTISFSGDSDTGIYDAYANNLGVSTGGTQRLNVSSTGLDVTGAITATTTITATTLLQSGNGTVGAPSIGPSSDPDTGIYEIGANNLGVAAAGAKVLDISSTGLGVTGTTLSGDGTVSLPGIGFSSDTDSGVYRIGANNIGVAVNGAKVIDIATTGAAITGVGSTTGVFTATGGIATGAVSNYKSTTGMAATVGGAQAGTALLSEVNDFTTVTNAADSAQLPVAVLGKKVIVRNSAAKSMAVFGQTGDAIDGAAANASFAVEPGQTSIFVATSGTTWVSLTGTSQGTISTVTQGSSITTGVTVNSRQGVITTFTPSTAGLAATTFTVTNNKCTANSNVRVWVTEYGGTVLTNGLPYVFAKNRTANGFDVIVYNAHATNALATSLKIGFEIIN